MTSTPSDYGTPQTKYGAIPTFEAWLDQTPTLKVKQNGQGNISITDLPDQFVPEYSSDERKSSVVIASLSLINTMVGGGVLSLPYAFRSLGYATGLIVVCASASVTMLSLKLLCKLTVKTGSRCYADVIRKTLGADYPELTDLVMFLLLFLVLIAFMCLLSDIGGDVAEYIYYGKMVDVGVGMNTINSGTTNSRLTNVHGFNVTTRHHIATAIAIVFIYPLMTTDSLHSLRHISFLGVASILGLLVVLVKKCIAVNVTHPDLIAGAMAGPASSQDFLTALPIVLIAYFVQFNVIDVYSSLQEPSQQNIDRVIHWTAALSSLIFAAFGIAGYFYAYGDTADNVLKNFNTRDPDLIYARTGLIITLICQTPMVGLPCRNTLILVLSHAQRWIEGRRTRSKSILCIEEELEMTPRTRSLSSITADLKKREITMNDSALHRYGIPLGIVLSSLFMSQILPGVGVVWSLTGSSVSILLAFLLPSLAYMKFWAKSNLRSTFQTPPRLTEPETSDLSSGLWSKKDTEIFGARALFYTSCILMVCCTYDSVRKVL